jgi:hypothetical protein
MPGPDAKAKNGSALARLKTETVRYKLSVVAPEFKMEIPARLRL